MTNDTKYTVGYAVGFTSVVVAPFIFGVAAGIYAYRAGLKDGRRETWAEMKNIVTVAADTLKSQQVKTETPTEE